MPIPAATKMVAAEVNPDTDPLSCRIEPAPIKPMPGMICAAMRVGSAPQTPYQPVGQQCKHGRTETDEQIRAQARRPMLEFAFEADGSAKYRQQPPGA